MSQNEIAILNETDLRSKIYTIRGLQVMLDFDLAAIYGYETKRFNEQIKNNIERFDEDFRFQLSEIEFKNLRSNFSTSSWGGVRTTSISQVEDKSLYKNIISDLQQNPALVL